MLLVVGLHGCLESLKCAVILHIDGHVNLGRSGPEYYYALYTLLLLEVADVLAELLYHLPAGLAGHDIVAVETLGVVVVKSGLHGHDLLELVLYRLDVLFLEHFGIDRALISVGRIYVPCAEHNVVERCHGHDFVIFEIFLVGTFAHADFVILGH